MLATQVKGAQDLRREQLTVTVSLNALAYSALNSNACCKVMQVLLFNALEICLLSDVVVFYTGSTLTEMRPGYFSVFSNFVMMLLSASL